MINDIINDLQQIINDSKDNIIIKRLGNIIIKMNKIINENKKNLELVRNDINKLYNKFDELKGNNTIINKELIGNYGIRYIGQVLNGVPEGKGIEYYKDGDRYEGEWRNDKKEGKGIMYYNNGVRKMGDYLNDEPIGKHVILTKEGFVETNFY